MALSEWDALARLLVASGLTGLMGAEREIRRKEAGLRTFTLVGVGAALFTVIGPLLTAGSNADITRIAAQVVTGIGFIGAGLIFRQGSHTKNLTTAAGVWAAAAVGMAAGAGLYILACGATVIILVALTVYGEIERRIERPGRGHHEDDPPGPDAQ
ncbi:MAG TPA: MgtC/SapB family protein [Steroidobacteraceae bacterium]|nr:MgtC/SapB family protein [Steroidobacteraceae bacterium]